MDTSWGGALLFHDLEEVEFVVNELMTTLFESMPVWKYRADVQVEVFGFIKPTQSDCFRRATACDQC
jgi:hypothetical protein